MKKAVIGFVLAISFSLVSPVFAVDVAPRITDREIIDSLHALDSKIDSGLSKLREENANIRGDIKELRAGQVALDKRFDALQGMLGLLIAALIPILSGIVLILWNGQKRLSRVETTLETQKDELAFFKSLIEKLLPPRGVL